MNVLTNYLPSFAAAVDKLNKRAVKLGFPLITYEVVSEKVEKRIQRIVDLDNGGHQDNAIEVSVSTLKVTGDAPKLNGWNVTARIEPSEVAGSNFVYRTPLSSPDVNLDHLRHSTLFCDHCKTKRAKAKVYQITHDDGRTMVVGATCLKDFTRSSDVTALLSFLNSVSTLFSSEEDRAPVGADRVHEVKDLIRAAHIAIEARGFVSRKAADEDFKTATADYLIPGTELWKDFDYTNVTVLGDALYARADEIIEWATHLPETNDYLYSVKTALACEFVNHKAFGIIAAGVHSFLKDQEKKKEAESSNKSNEFFGTKGTRVQLPELKLISMFARENSFGTTFISKFEDAAGNLFVWFASKNPGEIGATFNMKGTIKDQIIYQGRKQTIITRCS